MTILETGVRPADSADAAEIARLASELGYPASHDQMERRLKALLDDGRHHVAVAQASAGRLAGWIHVEHRSSLESGERAEIMGLIVDPESRRKGVARLLVEEAESWARSCGRSELAVRSNIRRQASHRFYPALGYLPSKTQQVYIKAI